MTSAPATEPCQVCATKRRRTIGRGVISFGLVFLLLLPACGTKDPLNLQIEATNYAGYCMWKNRAHLSPQLEESLELSVQELKLVIQEAQLASGSQPVQEFALSTLNGARLGDLVHWGLQTRYQRLKKTRYYLEAGLVQGQQIIDVRADRPQSGDIQFHIERARKTLAQLEADMERTLALGTAVGIDMTRGAEKPATLTPKALKSLILESER